MEAPARLSNLSLRARIILIFLTMLLWLAAITCVQIYLFLGYLQQYNAMMETISLTNSINGSLKQKLDDEIRDIAYGKVPFENGTQYEHLNNMYENLYKIELDDQNGEFTAEINAVRKTLNTTTEYIDKLGEQIQDNVAADKRSITYEYITILTDLIDEKVQTLLQTTLLVKEQSQNEIAASLKRDITIFICLFIGAFLIALIFTWFISGSFVKPIRSLALKTNEIAEGNLTIGEIPIPSKNEIGDLCHSYNRMFHNLKDIIVNVRNTNNLVVQTSKDIHQSILENRLAGEEVADATQTISINLHKQDELIQKSVATFQTLLFTFNDVLTKSNTITMHSKETFQITNGLNRSSDHFVQQFETMSRTAEDLNIGVHILQKLMDKIFEHVRLDKLIARESALLTLTLKSKLPNKFIDKHVENTLLRIKELSDEITLSSQSLEDKITHVHASISSIGTDLTQNLAQIYDGGQQLEQMKKGVQAIRLIRDKQELEMKNISQDMQEAYDQMISMRQIITDIEKSSHISKDEVAGIAAMGEEQLTTLEEVSDASFKLVERIQDMNDSIRQFNI